MSATSTYIITAARVKALTFLADGVDDRKLLAGILDAQHALEQILGVTLYAIIEAAYPTYTGTAQTLYEQYIERFLAWKTKEESFVDLSAEADTNGVFTKSGDGYATVSNTRLADLMRKSGSRAENFQAAMLRYLRNLGATDAIKIAFDANVDCEPRTQKTYRARIVTRKSKWSEQNPDAVRRNWPHDEC